VKRNLNPGEMAVGVFIDGDDALDEDAFPEQELAVLSSRKDFAIRELEVGGDVGEFSGTELGDFSFKFKAGEGLRDFSKPRVKKENKRGKERDTLYGPFRWW